ncbi:MAG: hypothetical protein ABI885_25460 [Gammaproteobacteria bacterium]
MTADSLPAAVHTLLREHVMSFEQLEIILLLHRQPRQGWSATEISEDRRIPLELVADALTGLETSKLIRRIGNAGERVQLSPAEPATADAVRALALAYQDQHASVMSSMSMNAIERIRSRTLRAFSDSFVFGKRNGDG